MILINKICVILIFKILNYDRLIDKKNLILRSNHLILLDDFYLKKLFTKYNFFDF